MTFAGLTFWLAIQRCKTVRMLLCNAGRLWALQHSVHALNNPNWERIVVKGDVTLTDRLNSAMTFRDPCSTVLRPKYSILRRQAKKISMALKAALTLFA